MKKVLMGLALFATLSTISMAGPAVKGKKAKKAKAKVECTEAQKANCEKTSSSHCCMKKAQV